MLINWTLAYFVHSLMPKLTGFWHLACYLFPVLLDIIGREGNLENMGCFTLLIDEKNLELKWLVVEALKWLLIPMKLYTLLIQATGAYISINKCCNWSDGVTYSIQVVEYAEYWRCQSCCWNPPLKWSWLEKMHGAERIQLLMRYILTTIHEQTI